MAEKVVSVRLQARVEGFTAGMQKAKASVDDLTKAASPKKADAFGKMADNAALAGLGVAAAVGVAVKKFADFDQQMSAVKANSGATGQALEDLRAAAIKMGADSQFSATEAAQGINEMAKAGVSTSDILKGGLKGSLDLAAAGQISVADAAETAATAMTQFKLSGSQIPHVADLLANAANKAQGGVGDMAQALKQAGLVASSMGLSIEETTAGLTAFASAGLLGSDAGTAFKTMLQRLANPTGEALAQMQTLGISAYDAQGNFVGLANVAGQLKSSMEKMTPAQRAAAMSVIFGSDAVRAANVLYDQGAEGINKWTKEVSVAGAASKQAAALTDNLKGDLERLGGALDSVFINTGSGANGSLRALTQGVTALVDKIGAVPGPILLAGSALAAFALLAPKGALAYRNYRANLDTLGVSFEKISAKAPRTGAALEKTTAGAKKAAAALGAAATAVVAANAAFGSDGNGIGVQGLTNSLLQSDDAVKTFSTSIDKYARSQSNWFNTDEVRSFQDVLKASFDPSIGQSIDKTAGSLVGVSTDATNAKQRLSELDAVLTGLVSAGQAGAANELFDKFAVAAKDSGVSVDQLKSRLPQYAEALAGVSGAAANTAQDQGALTEATDAVTQSADDAQKALDNLRSAIEGLGSPLAAQRAAERDYQQAIDDSAERLKKRAELQKELAAAKASSGTSDRSNGPADSNADGKVSKAEAQRKAERDKAQRAADSDAAKRKAEEIARITAELDKYSKGFDVNTEAGRANQAALDNIRETTLKKVQADFDAVNATKGVAAATDVATKSMQTGRDAFIKAATAAGATKDEAKKLADGLGLVPKDVKILVSQSGAGEAEEAINKAARDRVATIQVQTRIANERDRRQDAANSDPVRKAQGGAIYGAGTATSDSIHALLSNGEHVWTAAEVKALGGQGAMYALRAAVRQGNTPRFASGGAVATSRFAPQRLAAGPSITNHTETHSSPIYVDKFQGPTVESLEREAERRRRAENSLGF